MSLIKNTAGQFLYAVLVNVIDGSPITTGATLSLAKDGAAGAAAGATLTHRISGLWEAALTQADSNGNAIGYVWAGANVIAQGGTIITVDDPRNALQTLQTGVTAVKTQTDKFNFTGTDVKATLDGESVSILAADLINIADAVFKRDWTLISGEAAYSLLNAARLLRNVWGTPGNVLTV